MKNLLLIGMILFTSISAFSQTQRKSTFKKEIGNVSIEKLDMMKDTVLQAQIVTVTFENSKVEEGSTDIVVIFFSKQVELNNFKSDLQKALVNCEEEKEADYRNVQTTGSKSEIIIQDDTKLKMTTVTVEEATEMIAALESISIKK